MKYLWLISQIDLRRGGSSSQSMDGYGHVGGGVDTLLKLKLYIYCKYLLLNLFYLHKAPKILQFNGGLLDNGCLIPFYMVVWSKRKYLYKMLNIFPKNWIDLDLFEILSRHIWVEIDIYLHIKEHVEQNTFYSSKI